MEYSSLSSLRGVVSFLSMEKLKQKLCDHPSVLSCEGFLWWQEGGARWFKVFSMIHLFMCVILSAWYTMCTQSSWFAEPCRQFRVPSSWKVHLSGHFYQPDLLPVHRHLEDSHDVLLTAQFVSHAKQQAGCVPNYWYLKNVNCTCSYYWLLSVLVWVMEKLKVN